jgi:hypothetical protein
MNPKVPKIIGSGILIKCKITIISKRYSGYRKNKSPNKTESKKTVFMVFL